MLTAARSPRWRGAKALRRRACYDVSLLGRNVTRDQGYGSDYTELIESTYQFNQASVLIHGASSSGSRTDEFRAVVALRSCKRPTSRKAQDV